jgi:hypothetical protein
MGKKRKHSESSSSSDEDPNLAEAVDPVFHQTLFEGKKNMDFFPFQCFDQLEKFFYSY